MLNTTIAFDSKTGEVISITGMTGNLNKVVLADTASTILTMEQSFELTSLLSRFCRDNTTQIPKAMEIYSPGEKMQDGGMADDFSQLSFCLNQEFILAGDDELDGHLLMEDDTPVKPKSLPKPIKRALFSRSEKASPFSMTPKKIKKEREPMQCSYITGTVPCTRITKGKYDYCSHHVRVITRKYRGRKEKKMLTRSLGGSSSSHDSTDPMDEVLDYSALLADNSPKKVKVENIGAE